MLTLYEFEQTNELMIAAHRGSSGTITENTLAAFADAIASGVKLIELDIQVTADNKLVVYHDFYLPDFENRIPELTYDEIKEIQIGPDLNGSFDSSHIPLLQDVIDLVMGKCYLMIEIKVNSDVKFFENLDKLVDMIIEKNYFMNTIVGSFNYESLRKIKSMNSSIYTAAIKLPGDVRLPSQVREDTGCDAFICSIDEINDEIDEDTLKNKIFTGVYTVDDEDSLKIALKHNVRAIATNYPDKILKLLSKIIPDKKYNSG